MLHVTVIEGSEVVRSQVLTTSPATVGRDASNDLVLRNKHISGKRAEISLRDGNVIFRDLGSTNGSWLRRNRWLIAVDARRSFTVEVQDGDELLLGNALQPVRLRFCMVEAGAVQASPGAELHARNEDRAELDRTHAAPHDRQALAVIHDFTARVSGNVSRRVILDALASGCLALFRGASDVVIYLCEGPSHRLRPVLHRGRTGQEPPRVVPDHVAVKTLRGGVALKFGANGQEGSSLLAPVLHGRQPVAIVQVMRPTGPDSRFADRDAEVLGELARTAAAPLANAQLRSAVETSLARLVAAAESRDEYRAGRTAAIAELVERLAVQLGASRDDRRLMHRAALLHDVGMIAVPIKILHSALALDPLELEIVRSHVQTGVQILSPVPLLADLVPIVQHHHEYWDGSGYPHGIAGESIPLGSRILAVADGFHSLVSERPYRAAVGQEEALSELERCSGNQYDPAVVQALLRVVDGTEFWAEGIATATSRRDAAEPILVLPGRR